VADFVFISQFGVDPSKDEINLPYSMFLPHREHRACITKTIRHLMYREIVWQATYGSLKHTVRVFCRLLTVYVLTGRLIRLISHLKKK
jgi:hypothetical protein